MTEIVIRPCTVAELEQSPKFKMLLDEYAAESSIPELGTPNARMDIYRAMEMGGMHVIGAFSDELIGFITVLAYGAPHYDGRLLCVTESFFVSPSERAGGTGAKLLLAAEQHARNLGATAFTVIAPEGGRLSKVLPHSGYRPTNQVFLKALA